MKPPGSRTLYDLLREQAADATAIVAGGRATRYGELATAASRLAAGMRRRGIGHGERVGILVENRREWLETAFAAWALGAVAVPFSTWSTEAELGFLIGDAGVSLLVADAAFAAALAALVPEADAAPPGAWRSARFPHLRTLAILDVPPHRGGIAYDDLPQDAVPLPPAARPEDDALVLYTSGSSARPKAVRLRHGDLIGNGFHIGERMRLSAADRVLLAPPLFWAYGACNALPATFSHGAALVLQPRFEPGGWLELIEREGCTAIYTLPNMTGTALRHPQFRRERVASLRTGLMIGSPEEVRIAAEEFGAAQICNIYGATETYGNCCVTPADWPLARRMAGQGPPLPGARLRIVDPETGAAVPPGTAGEVEVAGTVTPGYGGASAGHNRTAFTADGYFRTGDIGCLDAGGDFHFVARGSDVIKRAGINVSPAEVESLLLRHPEVAAAAVVGTPAGERGEAIVAFVVAAPGAAPAAEALRRHCRSLASAYKVPDRIELCPELPVTPTGKVFRRELKERAAVLVAGQQDA